MTIQNQNIDEKSENNSSSASFDEDLKKEIEIWKK